MDLKKSTKFTFIAYFRYNKGQKYSPSFPIFGKMDSIFEEKSDTEHNRYNHPKGQPLFIDTTGYPIPPYAHAFTLPRLCLYLRLRWKSYVQRSNGLRTKKGHATSCRMPFSYCVRTRTTGQRQTSCPCCPIDILSPCSLGSSSETKRETIFEKPSFRGEASPSRPIGWFWSNDVPNVTGTCVPSRTGHTSPTTYLPP